MAVEAAGCAVFRLGLKQTNPIVFDVTTCAKDTCPATTHLAPDTDPNPNPRPKVASGGAAGFLVVWRDERNGLPDIYGTKVFSDGNVLSPGGAPIETNPAQDTKPMSLRSENPLIELLTSRLSP